MGWVSCMESKIANTYGSEAAQCANGLSSGNLGEIAECIVGIVGNANPVTVGTNLAGWSIACAFDFAEDFKQVQSAAKSK